MPSLSPEQLRRLSVEGTRWIEAQRARHRPRGRPLSAAEVAELSSFFPPPVLRQTRLCVVSGVRRPPLRTCPARERLAELLDFRGLEGIVFVDTIVLLRPQMPTPAEVYPLLFHELVHVLQFHFLGPERLLRLYLRQWAACGFDYHRLPLERLARLAESRYRKGRAQRLQRRHVLA